MALIARRYLNSSSFSLCFFAILFQLSLSLLVHYRCLLYLAFDVRYTIILTFSRYTLFLLFPINSWTFSTTFGFFNVLIVFLWLFSFRSSLLSKSRLISFPFVTKIFQFTKFFFFQSFLLRIS